MEFEYTQLLAMIEKGQCVLVEVNIQTQHRWAI